MACLHRLRLMIVVLGPDMLSGHRQGSLTGVVAVVMTGDVMHNPVQCAYPGNQPDADVTLAMAAPRKFIERRAATPALVLDTHFPAGRFAAM